MRGLGFVLVAGVAALLGGCRTDAAPPAADAGPQNWRPEQRLAWYRATQGSRLVPLAWFKALEADDGRLFLDPAHMARFRYLPLDPDLAALTARPEPSLPVGFAVDRQPDAVFTATRLRWFAGQGAREPWVGMNCAACHTGELRRNGRAVRIDGGPGLGDYQSFTEAVAAALARTSADSARFDRFAARVLAGRDTPPNRALLAAALAKAAAWEARIDALNETPLRYGPARVDAFGHIFNKVVAFAGGPDAVGNPSDAPVSYPFLWNTHQSDRVQWNGIARNNAVKVGGRFFDYGALGRNAGEVVGVFGEVDMVPGGRGFPSSVDVKNLNAMEVQLARLKPPVWPVALFGAVDAERARRGRQLFVEHCRGCHQDLARDDLTTRFKARMSFLRAGIPGNTPPGTDPWMACNAFDRVAATGRLAGVKGGYVVGAPLADQEPVAGMLRATVVGLLVGKPGTVIGTALSSFVEPERPPRIEEGLETADDRPARLDRCLKFVETDSTPILGYKARPLTGVWATPPFLHNGSVPTLFDLMLPPDQRPRSFRVGTREYDPARGGYRVDAAAPGNDFEFVARDEAGRPVDGNANTGHDYGNARFSDADRQAIVDYLKTI